MRPIKRSAKLRSWIAGGAFFTGCLASAEAGAQYRLRADAYAAAADPMTGFVMLSSEARQQTWADAEAVMWLGTGDYRGDVMVASIRVHDPSNYIEGRLGRQMLISGGLRPVHFDGAQVTARAPWGTSVTAFGGMPVAPTYDARDFDWAVGGRLGQRISNYGALGVSYLHMRHTGAVTYEAVGLDAAASPVRWLDAAFSGSVDLVSPALADARVSLATRFWKMRLELFGIRRSPSHLLPATSLFSALGDIPSQRAGGALSWQAAPRLDILGEGAAESLGGELASRGMLRATLRLDDRGDGALMIEGRRESIPNDNSWTGVRATARVPLGSMFVASTELELVMPDDPRGRGKLWPWGLVALRWKPLKAWEVAGAAEASASPTAVSSVSGLLRVAYVWSNR